MWGEKIKLKPIISSFARSHKQFRLIIHRSEPKETETLEIELLKKPGKYLGVGFTVGNPNGIVLSSIVSIILIYHKKKD